LYWENDRTFTTQPGLELLQEMRTDVNQLSEKVDELELFLRHQNDSDEQENLTTWGVKAIGADLSCSIQVFIKIILILKEEQ